MQSLTPALFALPAVAGAAALLVGLAVLMRGAGAAGRRGLIAVLAVGGAAVFLGGTAFAAPVPHAAAPVPAARPTAAATPTPTAALQPLALAALDLLPVEQPVSMAGYDRVAAFGAVTAGAATGARVVTLSDAWRTGAQRLTLERRTAFANDPLNRLAVGGSATGCTAVAQRIAVKRAYDLSVTPTELAGLQQALAGCPALRLPATGAA